MLTTGRVALVLVIVSLALTVLWFGRRPDSDEVVVLERGRRAVERAEVRRPYAALAAGLATAPVVVFAVADLPATRTGEIQLLFGLAAYLVGVALLTVGLSSRPAYVAVHRGSVDDPGTVRPGYAAVAGVAAGGSVTAPVSGETTCWYECRISGSHTPPGRVDEVTNGSEFEVTGQGATVRVDADHVEIREAADTDTELTIGAEDPVPDRLEGLVADGGGVVRATESRVDPGDPVTVVGRFERREDGVELVEDAHLPAYVFAGNRRTVVDRLRARVLGLLPAGTVLMLVGAVTVYGALTV